MQTPIRELDTGSTFAGRYQIIEELGHGGMGRVYKAFDTDIKEKIALKLLRPEIALDKETIERFSNELKLARRISHRHVCRMFDLGKAESTTFITMEFVPGEDLKKLIRKTGQLGAGRAVSIAKQVCEGLAEAHHFGIIHRDLKCQNIMVDEDGNARIMDFGIARSLGGKGITGAGVLIGTPEYMSPEQVEGKELDHRSDIYSLGVILYEMVTGRVPFEGDTPFTIGVKHKSEIPRDPRELNTQIPQDLGRLVLKCLEKDKAKRYQTAEELRSDLEKVEQGLPTTERVVSKRKPFTSKEITVTFSAKKLFIPSLAFLVLIAASIILWRLFPAKKAAPPLGASGRPTLAILYFENISGDKNLDPWKTGLTELFITKLSQSRFINVLDGNTVFSILKKLNLAEAKKYTKEDLLKVASEGQATYTLSGSLMKAGPSLIITLSLQKPDTGEVVSSSNIECRSEQEIFPKVDDLAQTIKSDLNLTQDQVASDINKEIGKITTSSPEAFKYYSQGSQYLRTLDWKQCIALMEKAVSVDAGFAMAYRAMAMSLNNLGLRTKAKLYAKKALELSGRTSDRERFLIQALFYLYSSEKTYDKAIEANKKLLELNPDDFVAHFNLARIYSLLEDLDKAVEQYEIAFKLGKDKARVAIYNLALVYGYLGKYEKARQILEEQLKNTSDLAYAHRALAYTYLFEGKYDLAESDANKAFCLGPTDYSNTLLNGSILYLKGDLFEAEKEWQKAVETAQKEDKFDSGVRLASLYSLMGKFEKSRDQLKKAIELSKQTEEAEWEVSACFYLAANSLNTNNYLEALKACDEGWNKAFENESLPWQRYILHMKGLVYLRMKSLGKAQKTANELKDFIEKGLNKKEIRLYHHLQGLIELARKDYAKSIEHLNKAASSLYAQSARSFWDALFHDSLARAYSAAGDLKNAQKEFEKILSLTQGRFYWGEIYARSYYNLGMIYEKQGQKDSARENHRKFLDLWKDADPGLPEVPDAKSRLAKLS